MRFVLLILLTTSYATEVIGQKRLSEGIISYNVSFANEKGDINSKSQYIQLLKGSHSRDEMIGSIGITTTIFDSKEGNGAIIKEYGGQKILIPITFKQWESKIKKISLINFKEDTTSQVLLGYACKKAIASMEDGTTYEVWFTQDIVPENQQLDFQFPQLKGLVLKSKVNKPGISIEYLAASINFDPVPIQKFDLPQSGYRVLSYEESIKMKN